MLARMLALSLGLALPALLGAGAGPNAALISLGAAALCACSRRTHPLGAVFIGLAVALVRIQGALDARLPMACEGLDMDVTGRVIGLPDERPGYQRFRFDVEWASLEECKPQRVELRAYYHLALKGDQRWRLKVRLRRVHGFANPGGFDFEGDRWHRGILASGYVRKADTNALLEQPMGLHAARSHLRSELQARLSDSAAAGVVRALAIGDRGGVPGAYWEVLNLTGTTHLAVISGLHVGMVATALFGLGLVVVRLLGTRLARWPAPTLATVPAFLGAVGYAALAGFTLPTQRALVMVCVGLFTVAAARRVSPATGIATALVLVLLLDPLAPMAPGFWLSFVAVASLIFVFVHRVDPDSTIWRRLARRALWAQLGVFVALFLPLLMFTQRSALIAPIANLFAIPVVGFLVVPMTLVGALALEVAPPVADFFLYASEWTVRWLFALLEWMSRHAPVVSPGMLTLPSALAIAAGSVLFLLPRGATGRWLWLLVPCVLLVPRGNGLVDGQVRITTLDVGQGLAVLAQTREHTLLYDTGPRFGPGADAGQLVVVPTLRALGVEDLDALIVSHADADHAGGAASVLAAVPTARVLVGTLDAARTIAQPAELCRDGSRWVWDDVSFELFRSFDASAENDRSCVLMITAAGGTVLLPGDVTAVTERGLALPRGGIELLIAPHHGSRSSSSAGFVKELAPRHVIFSVGYRNPFGHPHPVVVERYRQVGSRLHTTSGGGALTWNSSSPSELSAWRTGHRRYWNQQSE